MKARVLLAWILAWVQLGDAASFSIEVWCDSHGSQTPTRVIMTRPSVTANITVDEFFDSHEAKIHDYCLKHCCHLGTCNVGKVEGSGNTAVCLMYGSYSQDQCVFERTAGNITYRRNETEVLPVTSVPTSLSPRKVTATTVSTLTISVRTTSKPEVIRSSSTTEYDAPTTVESTITVAHATAQTGLASSKAWHKLFKLLRSSVKPRKGVQFHVNEISRHVTTASEEDAYKKTSPAESRNIMPNRPSSTRTPTFTEAAAAAAAYTKDSSRTKTSFSTTESPSGGTASTPSALNLKTTTTTTPKRPAATPSSAADTTPTPPANPTTTTSPTTTVGSTTSVSPTTAVGPATTQDPTTTDTDLTTVNPTTTTNSPTTTPKTRSPTTVSTTASPPPLWETMLTQSNHSTGAEETTHASVTETSRGKDKQTSTVASAAGDTTPVRVRAQTAFVLEVHSKEESAPMGLIVGLSLGLVFIFIVLGIACRQIVDLWQRRHYSRMDFLVDGMYH